MLCSPLSVLESLCLLSHLPICCTSNAFGRLLKLQFGEFDPTISLARSLSVHLQARRHRWSRRLQGSPAIDLVPPPIRAAHVFAARLSRTPSRHLSPTAAATDPPPPSQPPPTYQPHDPRAATGPSDLIAVASRYRAATRKCADLRAAGNEGQYSCVAGRGSGFLTNSRAVSQVSSVSSMASHLGRQTSSNIYIYFRSPHCHAAPRRNTSPPKTNHHPAPDIPSELLPYTYTQTPPTPSTTIT